MPARCGVPGQCLTQPPQLHGSQSPIYSLPRPPPPFPRPPRLTGLLPVVLYLSYMGLLVWCLFLAMGTIGFLSSFAFTYAIFNASKSVSGGCCVLGMLLPHRRGGRAGPGCAAAAVVPAAFVVLRCPPMARSTRQAGPMPYRSLHDIQLRLVLYLLQD